MQVYETGDNLTKAQVKKFLTWFDKEIGIDYEDDNTKHKEVKRTTTKKQR